MANEKKQKREDLGVKIGDQIIITGVVAFSELATKVEGDALTRKIARQKDLGMLYPETKPHYSVAITDVAVKEEYRGTPLAEYYGQEVYTNKDGKSAMTLESKSPFAPKFYHMQENGNAVEIKELPNELAPGQEVEILINAFGSKKFANLGSAFNAFLLPEGDIKYYLKDGESQIEAFGVKLEGVEETVVETASVDVNDNPFGASEVETPSEPEVEDVPEDAKPDEPATGGAVNNPFA